MKNANPHMINELSNLNSTKFQGLFPISSSIIISMPLYRSPVLFILFLIRMQLWIRRHVLNAKFSICYLSENYVPKNKTKQNKMALLFYDINNSFMVHAHGLL